MGDDRVSSAEQDAWVETAAAIHAALRKYGETIPAMKPDEAKTFVDAVSECYWLSVRAAIFDKKIELEQARAVAD